LQQKAGHRSGKCPGFSPDELRVAFSIPPGSLFLVNHPVFKYIFFPKPYSYPIKIIERVGTNFVTRLWGLLASPLPISEEQKTNARKLSLVSCELKFSG
jgi:hypothetical protein